MMSIKLMNAKRYTTFATRHSAAEPINATQIIDLVQSQMHQLIFHLKGGLFNFAATGSTSNGRGLCHFALNEKFSAIEVLLIGNLLVRLQIVRGFQTAIRPRTGQ